jgi:hypothetical protein
LSWQLYEKPWLSLKRYFPATHRSAAAGRVLVPAAGAAGEAETSGL